MKHFVEPVRTVGCAVAFSHWVLTHPTPVDDVLKFCLFHFDFLNHIFL